MNPQPRFNSLIPAPLATWLSILGFQQREQFKALFNFCRQVDLSMAIINLRKMKLEWLCIEKYDHQWVEDSPETPLSLLPFIHPEDQHRLLKDIKHFYRFNMPEHSSIYRTLDSRGQWHWDIFSTYAIKRNAAEHNHYGFVIIRHLTKAIGNCQFFDLISQEEKEIRSKFFDFRLTAREKEVLILIGKAMSDKEIADELMVSPLTIATHRRNLLKKLNARNKNELIKMVHENMLV